MANAPAVRRQRPIPAVNAAVAEHSPSDRQLLESYIARRDEDAFAVLVLRYGGTVWSVCRRLLQEQDAEDAFQAVFALLAQKAASIRKPEAVGSWLYGVAYRTAMRVRRSLGRRQKLERHASLPNLEQPAASEASCRELQRVLDDEVQRLGDKYRVPFVLCCLEGLNKAEAARELGLKEGTVSSRLTRARQILHKRLVRRGISLSAVLTAATLSQNLASASAPAALLQTTVQALAGKAAALSPKAVALTHALAHGMTVAKIKGTLAFALALIAVVTSAGLAALYVDTNAPAPPDAPIAPAKVNEAKFFLQPAVSLTETTVEEDVLTLAFSPDGKRLATGGTAFRPNKLPGQLMIWDVVGGKELAKVQSVPGIRAVAFAPDGKTLATGEFGGTIRLRDPVTGKDRNVLKGHTGGVNSLAFSSDSTRLASAGLDSVVKVWDLQQLKEQQALRGHTNMVLSVAFFRHGRAIVSGSKDGTARIWDLSTGKEKFTLRGHLSGVETVAISPDDKLVATASWDRTFRLWDAQTGKQTAVFRSNKRAVYGVAFSPDGKLLAYATEGGTVGLWDVKTRQPVGNVGCHASLVWAVTFSPDGKYLASGSADKTAKLWNVAGMKNSLGPAALHVVLRATTVAMEALPGGAFGAAAASVTGVGLGGMMRCFEEEAAFDTREFKPIRAMASTPDGKVIAVAASDKTVQLRDAKTGAALRQLSGHTSSVSSLAFSPDGRTLASGSADKTVKLWDWATAKVTRTLAGHDGTVTALAFTPDGTRFAAGSDDGLIRVWDPVSAKSLGTVDLKAGPIRALAWSRDGRRLAIGGAAHGLLMLWDPTQKGLMTREGHEAAISALAFSADGTLASASQDGTVRLWDPSQPKPRVALSGHLGPVRTLAFSASGRTLVSGGQDGSISVWDAAAGRQRQFLRAHKTTVAGLLIHPSERFMLSAGEDGMLLRWNGADASAVDPPVAVLPSTPGEAIAGDWPMWRGPGNNGIRANASPVVNWSDTDGVRWKAAVPGEGHASPVVVGERVFVSTADEQTETRSVLCFHRQTGALLWNTVLDRGGFMAKHNKNSHASPTPACDGRRLYIPFVANDALWLHAIDVNGQPAWKCRIGPFAQREGEAWGYASSPALYKDLVIVSGDNQGSDNSPAPSSYLAAVRSDTGEVAWRVPRPRAPSYGTPIVARIAGRDQLVLAGAGRITAYDPASGKELWFCRWSAHRSASSVAFGPDCVYSSTDWPERQILCVRADGNGDVTDSHIVWRQARGASDVPSTLYHQGRLYVANNNGMMTCLDGANGKVAWQKRLGTAFSASPVAAGDHIFATDEGGTTHVIELGDPVKVLAQNSLREPVLASLAFSGNDIFIRGRDFLWCLDGKSHGLAGPGTPLPQLVGGTDILYQDFRGRRPLLPALRLTGADAETVTRPEQEGLRISLPAVRPQYRQVGVAVDRPLSGDFEITGTYEILSYDQPREGNAGVAFNIACAAGFQKFAKLGYFLRSGAGGNGFVVESWHKAPPKFQKFHLLPAVPGKGQLRLLRLSSTLHYLIAQDGKDFRETYRHEFGDEDVQVLRFFATQNVSRVPIDARLIDLRIRGRDTPAPQTAVATGEGESTGWQSLAGLVLLGGMLLLLGMSFVVSRRHQKNNSALSPAPPSTQAAAVVATPVLLFRCSGCGRKLRCSVQLAGTYIRCTQCGQKALAPEKPPPT